MSIVLRNNQYGQGKGTSMSPSQIWLKREINYSTGHQRRENHLCLMGQHLLFIKRFNITHHSRGKKGRDVRVCSREYQKITCLSKSC